MARSKRPPSRLARVAALPGHRRPEDSLKHINAALAAGDVRGVMVALVSDEGAVSLVKCGDIRNDEMCWAGACLLHDAVN